MMIAKMIEVMTTVMPDSCALRKRLAKAIDHEERAKLEERRV